MQATTSHVSSSTHYPSQRERFIVSGHIVPLQSRPTLRMRDQDYDAADAQIEEYRVYEAEFGEGAEMPSSVCSNPGFVAAQIWGLS